MMMPFSMHSAAALTRPALGRTEKSGLTRIGGPVGPPTSLTHGHLPAQFDHPGTAPVPETIAQLPERRNRHMKRFLLLMTLGPFDVPERGYRVSRRNDGGVIIALA